MTNKQAIIKGYLDDISNNYRECFEEVKSEIEKYGQEGVSVLNNNNPFRCYLLQGTAINKTCSLLYIDKVRTAKTDYFTSFEGHVVVENGQKCDKWVNIDSMHMEDVLSLVDRIYFD